ncbi:carbohydrate binding domain-containing protein [Clostridium nigeriense]|uniref:carbohydrate binding domain-containing protein n=1 Tax=Clostridium nigeriense TaxID=1805470 RepID=UPI00082DA883|nr:carbohydrate binding domain-containing protein [Clostridium nigeriense]
MIGATTSQSLDLTLLNKGDIVYGTSTIKVEIGLKIGSTVEYIPMGIYNIDDIEKTDYTIKITAYDNMIKFEKNFTTTLGDYLTLQQVVSELTRITGVEFTGSLPSYTVKKLEGFSCREVLGYVASLCGGNAVINRDGKFIIVTPKDINYPIGTSNYFIGDYKREETKYKMGKISCQAGEEVLTKGTLGADSMELEFENPWVTTAILNDIYTKLNGFEYLGYSMKWQGDLSLDVGDIVTITDKKGVVRKHPILSQKFTYTGGLTSELGAKGETKNKNSFSSSGSTAKKVERVVMELALINKALIDVAYIGDLTAGNIKFDTASGTILDLQTLLSKFVTGENGQFLNLTTDNVVIANAVIKDAMIDSLSLNKLKAGTINTNTINLASADGGLSIVGPTMQFKDKANKVRLQLGQDTAGDFNFILIAADGTTTLIDGYGIKEKAIADKLIKSNMVADNAIGEQQINYSSLVTGLNKDTNTSLIQASKVAIDLTGQSLDVAFNSLKSSVNGFDERIEANTTSISVAQGKIEGLIKESAITKSDVTTLKDNYTSIKATVDGINTTVASHTTSISTLDGKISKVETKATTVEQGLEGFKVTVSNNYITKTDAENSYATKASMELTANQLKLDFSKTGIANIVPNSSFEDGLNGWNYYTSGGSIVATIVDTTGDNPQSISALRMGVSNFSYTGGYHRFVDLEPDTTYTISAYIRISALTSLPGRSIGIIVNEYSGTTPLGINNLAEYTESTINTSKWVRVTKTFTTGANTNRGQIYCRISNISNGVIYYDNIKLEKGTFATDWTSGENEIYSGNTIIDANGVTIKNGALTIKNKANANVLTSDTNGDLTITGTFINKNSNGVKAVEINNTNIYLYDWERSGRELGIIYSSYLTDYPNVRGFSLAHNQQGYMTLGYRTGKNTFGHYIILDKYSKNPSYTSPIRVLEGTVFSQAVNMQNRVYVPDIVCFEGSYNSTTPQIFKNTGDSRNLLCVQVSVNAKNDGFLIQSNTGSKLFAIEAGYPYPVYSNTNFAVNGNFTASGSKNSLQTTKNYGERLINAYETAEYYYSDIGFGKINDSGECYISIDDILQECVNLDCEYHIFTQKYNGEINIIDRHRDYFVVYGEPGTEFSWQYIAKRIGYENVRLDQPELVGYLDNSVVFTEEEFTVKTSEEILIQELDFKLEDILLEVA